MCKKDYRFVQSQHDLSKAALTASGLLALEGPNFIEVDVAKAFVGAGLARRHCVNPES